MLCYDYDNKIEDPYPDYSKIFTYGGSVKTITFKKRYGYMIKEFTIELGSKEYTYTYTHYSNYKKDI